MNFISGSLGIITHVVKSNFLRTISKTQEGKIYSSFFLIRFLQMKQLCKCKNFYLFVKRNYLSQFIAEFKTGNFLLSLTNEIKT